MSDPEMQQQRINRWLRYHTNYQVTINLYALYGCISVEVKRDSEQVLYRIGTSLSKRLDEVILFLDIGTWERGAA
jgi:hypothetical protein